MINDYSIRQLLILILQLTIIKNAKNNNWKVRILNDKQIEIIKEYNKNDDIEIICKNLIHMDTQ